MTNENEFLQKLMISKKIMDRHNEMPRSGSAGGVNENYSHNTITSPELETFNSAPSKFNIPEEYIPESQSVTSSQKPLVVTEERIKNSKLPDAIKKLMIENPINQPQQYTPTLSNDLIEKAARLMGDNKSAPNSQPQKTSSNQQSTNGDLKKMVKEAVEEILRENGLITESETKSQETFQFRVGKHIFEGKIMKVKKLS